MTWEEIENKYGPLEIGKGWYEVVKPLFEFIEKYNADKKSFEKFTEEDKESGAVPKIQIHQIKEKFGGLRFYTGYAPKEFDDLVEEAEDLSYEVCEECGKPGHTRKNEWYWLCTLCDECAKKYGYGN